MSIRVFLVEDSEAQAQVISRRLMADGDIQVVGVAETGRDCLRQVPLLRPDVVVMDGRLPNQSGPEVTAKLLEVYPVPVILFTQSPEEYKDLAEMSGAVATVSKNPPTGDSMETLVKVIRLMNGMKVVRRKPILRMMRGGKKFLLIGSSSGGPLIVADVLREITPETGLTVVLVQHLSAKGTTAFVEWLAETTPWPCSICREREIPRPGRVYVGPAGYQLLYRNGTFTLSQEHKGHHFAPSVDCLFTSFSHGEAQDVIAMVLSGIGTDGAKGLLDLRLAGATTLVQDPTTAAVSGMPEAAISHGGALQVVPTEKLGRVITASLVIS